MPLFLYNNLPAPQQQYKKLAAVVALLLPHLDALDKHLALVLPRGVPLVSGVPEVPPRSRTGVHPRLSGFAVLEPAVCAADGDVDDQVEVLVEGRGLAARLAPRVHEAGAVGIRQREMALLPEGLVEVVVHDLDQARVDIGENVLLAPLHAESVEGLGVGGELGLALDIRRPPCIGGDVRPKVQRAADDVVATGGVRVVVAARLHDVDLARPRPVAVGCVLGQHPDGGPQPVALGQLRHHLHPSKLDVSARLGIDACRLDRIDDGAVSRVGRRNAAVPVRPRARAGVQQVDDVVRVDEFLVLQRGLEVQHAILDECVLVGVGCHFELAVAVFPRQQDISRPIW